MTSVTYLMALHSIAATSESLLRYQRIFVPYLPLKEQLETRRNRDSNCKTIEL